MKPTEDEMRALLAGDTKIILINTLNDYIDDPTNEIPQDTSQPRESLIDDIVSHMITYGDISKPSSTILKLSDIARELDIDPKVARAKMRQAISQGKLTPSSLKMAGWVFNHTDKLMVMNIIKPRKT